MIWRHLQRGGRQFLSRAIILGDNFSGGHFRRGQLSSEAIVRGAIIQGVLIHATIVRVQLSGGQFSLGAIVQTPLKLDQIFTQQNLNLITINSVITFIRYYQFL